MERPGFFEVTSELKAYPAAQSLEMRLRQAKPDVVFIDVASDLDGQLRIHPHLSVPWTLNSR